MIWLFWISVAQESAAAFMGPWADHVILSTSTQSSVKAFLPCKDRHAAKMRGPIAMCQAHVTEFYSGDLIDTTAGGPLLFYVMIFILIFFVLRDFYVNQVSHLLQAGWPGCLKLGPNPRS